MTKSKRGFASMSQAKRTTIAKNAGIKAHKLGRAHEFTKEEAVLAGRIGGKQKKNYKKYKTLSNPL